MWWIPAGTEALTRLLKSAKLCGVEPHAYLREATLRTLRNPGTKKGFRIYMD